MAVSWKYVKFGASEGEAQKGNQIRESHVECVCLDRLEEGSCFGYTPLFFKTHRVHTQISWKCIPSQDVCSAAGLCPCALSACGA